MIRSADLQQGLRALEGQEEKISQELGTRRRQLTNQADVLHQERSLFSRLFSRLHTGKGEKLQSLKSEYEGRLRRLSDQAHELQTKRAELEGLGETLKKVSARRQTLEDKAKSRLSAVRDFLSDQSLQERMVAAKGKSAVRLSSGEEGVSKTGATERLASQSLTQGSQNSLQRNEELAPRAKLVEVPQILSPQTVQQPFAPSQGSGTSPGTPGEHHPRGGEGNAQMFEHWKGEDGEGVRIRYTDERVGEVELSVEELYSGGLIIDLNGARVHDGLDSRILQELRRARLSVKRFSAGE